MRQTLLALAASAAAAISVPANAAPIIVSLNPVAQSVAIGDTITVNVNISGLGSEILSAFDLNVLFNPSLAAGAGIDFFGTQFGTPDDYFTPGFSAGNIGAIGGSYLDDAMLAGIQTPDAFQFLTFKWTAVADGALLLNFGSDPDFERNVVGRDALSLDARFLGTCIAIGTGSCNTVPEPASYGLAGLALLGCGLATTRRRRTGAPAAG